MDNKPWHVIRDNAGFIATMAACLLAVGISGYFLLFDGAEEPQSADTPPAEIPVAAPIVEIQEPDTEEEEVPAVAEAVSTAPVEVETPSMPEMEVDDTPVIAEAPRLIVSPVNGEVLAAFSMDELIYNETLEDWRTHDGMDIAAAPGTTVLAACSGTVLSVENDALMGTTVVIKHDGGYETTYANLQAQPNVEAGDSVSAGQIIGAVGTTAAAEAAQGSHLHFSVAKDGEAMDPDEFLDR